MYTTVHADLNSSSFYTELQEFFQSMLCMLQGKVWHYPEHWFLGNILLESTGQALQLQEVSTEPLLKSCGTPHSLMDQFSKSDSSVLSKVAEREVIDHKTYSFKCKMKHVQCVNDKEMQFL